MSRKTTVICDVCFAEKKLTEMRGFNINRRGTRRNEYYSTRTKNDFTFDVCEDCEGDVKAALVKLIPSISPEGISILFPPKKVDPPTKPKRKTATRRRRR